MSNVNVKTGCVTNVIVHNGPTSAERTSLFLAHGGTKAAQHLKSELREWWDHNCLLAPWLVMHAHEHKYECVQVLLKSDGSVQRMGFRRLHSKNDWIVFQRLQEKRQARPGAVIVSVMTDTENSTLGSMTGFYDVETQRRNVARLLDSGLNLSRLVDVQSHRVFATLFLTLQQGRDKVNPLEHLRRTLTTHRHRYAKSLLLKMKTMDLESVWQKITARTHSAAATQPEPDGAQKVPVT